MADAISYRETVEVLVRLQRELPRLVLVGGQALNYWAQRYRDRADDLRDVLTSKDIDFQGTTATVAACARLLNGKPFLSEIDHGVVNAGKVEYRDASGNDRQIDFLVGVFGLDAADVASTAVPVPLASDGEVRIMHPLLCMQSRVHNVVGLPGQYDNQFGRAQAAASIAVLREFVVEMLSIGTPAVVRQALDIYEATFDFSTKQVARTLFRVKGIDTFAAVRSDLKALPEKFRRIRYPQMAESLRKLRE